MKTYPVARKGFVTDLPLSPSLATHFYHKGLSMQSIGEILAGRWTSRAERDAAEAWATLQCQQAGLSAAEIVIIQGLCNEGNVDFASFIKLSVGSVTSNRLDKKGQT